MEALRKRAATMLSARQLQLDGVTGDRRSSQPYSQEKAIIQEKPSNEPHTPDSSDPAGDAQSSIDGGTEEPRLDFGHNKVQYLPPWIQDARDDDENEDDLTPASGLLVREPSATQVAQHNHTPSSIHPAGFLSWHKSEPGRKFDSRRRADPPTSRYHPREIASRWRQFAQATQYPRREGEHGQIVDEEYLISSGPDFYSNWREEHRNTDIHAYHPRRRTAWVRIQRTVLRSAFIPLVFRLLVLIFCVMALGLGMTIRQTFAQTLSSNEPIDPICSMNYETSTTSPLMAIVVDSAAILYLFGITWDEYRGLPLGLRSGKAKISVLLLDLFFIVFSSANVTLAFESIRDFSIGCQEQTALRQIKWKQDFLASVLLAALMSWLMTFAVSVLRVVEKFDR